MGVLVLGGADFIGRHLCTELDARDHDVSVLSGSPDLQVLPNDVDTFRGNVIQYESISPVFDGRDAVVNLVALSPMDPSERRRAATLGSISRWHEERTPSG